MALTTKVLTPREIARGAFLFGQAFARNEQFPNQGEFEGFYGAAYDASDSGDLHAKGAFYLVYIVLPVGLLFASVFPIYAD